MLKYNTPDFNRWLCAKLKSTEIKHTFLVSEENYDPINPLDGWTPPDRPVLRDTVSVLFSNNTIVNYTFVNGEPNHWEVTYVNPIIPTEVDEGNTIYFEESEFTYGDGFYPVSLGVDGDKVILKSTDGVIGYFHYEEENNWILDYYDLSVKNNSTFHIVGSGIYDPLQPLLNWEQPETAYADNTAIVQFTDGNTVFYTYDNGWVYDFKIGFIDEEVEEEVDLFNNLIIEKQAIYFDASDASTLAINFNNKVSEFRNKLSLTGKDVANGTAGSQPEWNYDHIIFDGINDFLESEVFTLGSPMTQYHLINQIVWSDGSDLLDGKIQNSAVLQQGNNGTPNLYVFNGLANTPQNHLPLNQWGIIKITFDGTNTKVKIDDFTEHTDITKAVTMGGITMGCRGGSHAQFGKFGLAKSLYFESVLTVEEDAIVHDKLIAEKLAMSANYNAFGVLYRANSGKLIQVYYAGKAHVDMDGKIVKRESFDNGVTWSQWVTIYNSAYDDRNATGGVTATGRLILFFARYNPDLNGTTYFQIGYMYSDDEGDTWSDFESITPLHPDYPGCYQNSYGAMITAGDGTLIQNYDNACAPIGYYELRQLRSVDNGATWVEGTVIYNGIKDHNELCLVYCGNNTIIGLARNEDKEAPYQFKSTDNGVTWIAMGKTNFENNVSNNNVSPWLQIVNNGVADYIVCYYCNRDTNYLYYRTALLSAVIADQTVWNDRVKISVGANDDYVLGYPSVIHINKSMTGKGIINTYRSDGINVDVTLFDTTILI